MDGNRRSGQLASLVEQEVALYLVLCFLRSLRHNSSSHYFVTAIESCQYTLMKSQLEPETDRNTHIHLEPDLFLSWVTSAC